MELLEKSMDQITNSNQAMLKLNLQEYIEKRRKIFNLLKQKKSQALVEKSLFTAVKQKEEQVFKRVAQFERDLGDETKDALKKAETENAKMRKNG